MILNNALKCYDAISHEMLWLKSFLESHKECQCKQSATNCISTGSFFNVCTQDRMMTRGCALL